MSAPVIGQICSGEHGSIRPEVGPAMLVETRKTPAVSP